MRDTPGILEAGEQGSNRERDARSEAVLADLILFVVDGDLRSSEFSGCCSLAEVGKRTLLVLNKCDLRGETEEQRLLQLLRRRCTGLVDVQDVVSASAAPQSVPRPGERPWQPPAEIERLLRRLAAVLRADGEELLADNILRASRLAETSQGLLDRQRACRRWPWWSATAGSALASSLSRHYLALTFWQQLPSTRKWWWKLRRCMASASAANKGSNWPSHSDAHWPAWEWSRGASLLGAALSSQLPTLIAGKAIQAVTAAWLTRLAGKSFITYFSQQQTLGGWRHRRGCTSSIRLGSTRPRSQPFSGTGSSEGGGAAARGTAPAAAKASGGGGRNGP